MNTSSLPKNNESPGDFVELLSTKGRKENPQVEQQEINSNQKTKKGKILD